MLLLFFCANHLPIIFQRDLFIFIPTYFIKSIHIQSIKPVQLIFVIIQGDKITCAGAVFPTTVDMKFSKRLGTRHRAAIGISEESDAIAIVVSEETGRVSIALKGEMLYNLTLDDVRMMLIDELKPKQEADYDEEEINEDEIYEEDK